LKSDPVEIFAKNGGVGFNLNALEVKKMRKNQKDLKVINLSQICGDGSCGCGCQELEEAEKVLSLEKIQRIRSSGDE
jgi:hypothetical protein